MHNSDNHRVSVGNCWEHFTRHACCWLRGLGAQSPRPSQSSGLEVSRTRAAMVSRQIKVTIKTDRWAVTPFWVMEQKMEPVTMGLLLEWITECINYEYLQSICKNKYFITCTKVVYISTDVFVKMYWFWILSSPPPFLLTATGWCLVWIYRLISSLNKCFVNPFAQDEVSAPFGVCVSLCKQT